MSKIKLSDKQKVIITQMREGWHLYENPITPGARWSLSKNKETYNWGNIHGKTVAGIIKLFTSQKINFAIREYSLNELGKTIEL